MVVIDFKKCSRCKAEKPAQEFRKKAGTASGLTSACNHCMKSVHVAYHAKNKARINARSAAFYRANKDGQAQKARIYYLKNRDAILRRNKERYNYEKERAAYLVRAYGISTGDVASMMEKQNGLCAICLKKDKLVVDHHHGTGRVRGLLCNRCNLMLGLLDEEIGLPRIREYLDGTLTFSNRTTDPGWS